MFVLLKGRVISGGGGFVGERYRKKIINRRTTRSTHVPASPLHLHNFHLLANPLLLKRVALRERTRSS